MNKNDAVQMLQHYRHDVSNHLQLISGYLAMGRSEVAEEKLEQWVQLLNEERKLMSLRASSFILWVVRFNSYYEQIRLTYKIHLNGQDLTEIDGLLHALCERLITKTVEKGDATILYEAELELSSEQTGMVDVFIKLKGQDFNEVVIDEVVQSVGSETKVHVQLNAEEVDYRFQIPFGKR